MKREYAADTLKWNLTDLLTKEKDRATLDFLCECVDFLLKQPKPDADVVTIKLPDDGMCAIVRKVKGRYVIDTGQVEKWPEEDE